MKKMSVALACLMATLCSPAMAQQAKKLTAPDFRAVLSLGYNKGGSNLGNSQLDTNMSAGSGLEGRAGVEIGVPDRPIAIELSAGFQSATAKGDGGDLKFSRVPLDLIAHFNLNPTWRVGVGMRKSLNTKLEATGTASALIQNQKYTGSPGPLVEVEYNFTPDISMKLRYVSETFEAKGSGKNLDGTHAGVFGSFYF